MTTVPKHDALWRGGVALASVLVLSACTLAPLAQAPAPSAPAPSVQLPPADDAVDTTALPGESGSASGAEQACVAAGRERGLDVVDVVGSRSVTSASGEAGRDVMLRVRRSGAEIELRCNYTEETRLARIMLI